MTHEKKVKYTHKDLHQETHRQKQAEKSQRQTQRRTQGHIKRIKRKQTNNYKKKNTV